MFLLNSQYWFCILHLKFLYINQRYQQTLSLVLVLASNIVADRCLCWTVITRCWYFIKLATHTVSLIYDSYSYFTIHRSSKRVCFWILYWFNPQYCCMPKCKDSIYLKQFCLILSYYNKISSLVKCTKLKFSLLFCIQFYII